MDSIDWNAVLGIAPRDHGSLRSEGYLHLKRRQYRHALVYFESLVLLDRGGIFDRQTLGALYLQLGRAVEAQKTLSDALYLAPHHLPTKLNLAKALFGMGRNEEGLELAEALSDSQDETIASLAQALVMAHRGQE
jgi:tetratricopeptide (TPR) repeat protein